MRLWGWSIVGFVMLLAAAAARAQTVGDVSVNVLPLPSTGGGQSTTHGYMEARVSLTNRSPVLAHQVTLTLPGDGRGGYGNSIAAITRTVTLAPNANAVVSLFQPPLPIGGEGLRVTIDGNSSWLSTTAWSHATDSYGGGHRWLAVLISPSLTDAGSQLSTVTENKPPRFSVHRSELPAAQWSNQWLGYTRFDAVMLRSSEMRQLPVEVGEALRRYVQAGGTLMVIGDGWSVPDNWGPRQINHEPVVPVVNVELGMVVPLTSEQQIVSHVDGLMELISRNNSAWENRPDLDAANAKLPVVEKLSIPVRGLLALIVLFAVVIGPVNLWVLGRKRRRMWLLWTVPTISILTCGAIWGYSLLAEGWRGQSRSRTLTILDQQNLTATTIGWMGFYAPLTPADGLRFSADTEVTPLVDRGYGYYRHGSHAGRSRTLVQTGEQHLDSGWIVARVPAYFMLRNTATPVRQRMIFTPNPDGTVNATNGLGIDIQRLTYLDFSGVVHSAVAPIPAGGKVTLTRIRLKDKMPVVSRWYPLYIGNWMDQFNALNADPSARPNAIDCIGPGMYLAVSDHLSPFIESGLKNLWKQRHETFILGVTTLGSPEP